MEKTRPVEGKDKTDAVVEDAAETSEPAKFHDGGTGNWCLTYKKGG